MSFNNNLRFNVCGNNITFNDKLVATSETKYILVGWFHSGACFAKELIRENFPECVNPDYWGKTHWNLSEETLNKYKNAKIFFILSTVFEHNCDKNSVVISTFLSVNIFSLSAIFPIL